MQSHLTFLALATIISLTTLSTYTGSWTKLKKQHTVDNTLPFPQNVLNGIPQEYLEKLNSMPQEELDAQLVEECAKEFSKKEKKHILRAPFKYLPWFNRFVESIHPIFEPKNTGSIVACIEAGANPNAEIEYSWYHVKYRWRTGYLRPIYIALLQSDYDFIAFFLQKGSNCSLEAFHNDNGMKETGTYPLELAKTVQIATLIVENSSIDLAQPYVKNLQKIITRPGFSPELITYYHQKGICSLDCLDYNPLRELINSSFAYQTPAQLRELAHKVRILLSFGQEPEAEFEKYEQMVTPLSLCKEESSQEKGRGPATVILEILNTHMANNSLIK